MDFYKRKIRALRRKKSEIGFDLDVARNEYEKVRSYEKKVIKTPFTKPIFFNTNNGYNASNIINYFFFDFYSYAMERYGIHDEESDIIWDMYRERFKKKWLR